MDAPQKATSLVSSRLAHDTTISICLHAAGGRYSACNSSRRLIMPKPNYKKAVASLAYIHMLVLLVVVLICSEKINQGVWVADRG